MAKPCRRKAGNRVRKKKRRKSRRRDLEIHAVPAPRVPPDDVSSEKKNRSRDEVGNGKRKAGGGKKN